MTAPITQRAPLVSLVIPVYCNELNLPVTWSALRPVLESLTPQHRYEVLFVDDGSTDGSFSKLTELQSSHPDHVRVLKLTRNFGQVAAVLAGFAHARGSCCATMSADLQDPPELITELVRRWDGGRSKIVLATRSARDDGWFASITSRVFYKLMRRFAIPSMPERGFDFFLIDRQVLDIVNGMQERNTFLQGQILWTGFPPEVLEYVRQKRQIGKSKWTIRKKVKYFVDGFVTYTVAPIRLISLTGLLISVLSVLYAAVIFAWWLIEGNAVKGWSPLMMAILLIGGLQLLMLGIIGEYLWRNYHETRRLPNYVVDRVLGGHHATGES